MLDNCFDSLFVTESSPVLLMQESLHLLSSPRLHFTSLCSLYTIEMAFSFQEWSELYLEGT